MMKRIAGNWQTSLAGLGVLLMTFSQWAAGDVALDLNQVVQLLIGAGFLGSKDANTGSAPGA